MKLLTLCIVFVMASSAIPVNAYWYMNGEHGDEYAGASAASVAAQMVAGCNSISGSWVFTCESLQRAPVRGDSAVSRHFSWNRLMDGKGVWPDDGSAIWIAEDTETCSAKQTTVHPVNIAHGETMYHFTDIRGGGFFPLEFQRVFRQKERKYSNVRYSGSEWYFNYISRKIIVDYRSKVYVQRGDGPDVYTFSRADSAEGYVGTNQGIHNTLSKTVVDGVQVGWHLVLGADDSVEEYNMQGQLTKEITKEGYSHSLVYDTTITPNTITISDDQTGKRLKVQVVLDRPVSVTELDAVGYPVTVFEWDSHNRLRAVVHPDTQVELYEYDAASDSAAHGEYINPTTTQRVTNRITGVFEISNTEYESLSPTAYPPDNRRFSRLTYDSSGRVTSSTLWNGGQKTQALMFSYNWSWNADTTRPSTTVTNSQGVATTYTYSTPTLSSNNWKLVSVNGSRAVTGATGCAATSATTTYDDNGFLNTTTDNTGTVFTRRTRDSMGRITVLETALNNNLNPVSESQKTVTAGFLGDTSQPIRKVYYGHTSGSWVAYRTEEFAYDIDGKDTRCSNAPVATNRICSITTIDNTAGSRADPADSRTTRYGYTYSGTPPVLATQIVVDPRGTVTTYAYNTHGDDSGQLHSVTLPAPVPGGAVQVTYYSGYNGFGKPTTIIDSGGAVTTLGYDVRGRLHTRSTTDGTSTFATTMDYYPNGLLQDVISPDGTYLKYLYDTAHQLTDVYQRRLSGTTPADVDALSGHVHFIPSVLNGKWTDAITYGSDDRSVLSGQYREFDTQGRLHVVNSPLDPAEKMVIGYDANNNLQTLIASGSGLDGHDSKNHVTYREFDKQNRIVCTMDKAPSAPLTCTGSDGATRYSYDDQGNVSHVVKTTHSATGATTPDTRSVRYTYNGFGELVTQVSQDSGTTQYTYDKAGNRLTKTTRRGGSDQQVITYGWDALNRLISITYPAGSVASSQNVAYYYDKAVPGEDCGVANGRLCRVVQGKNPASVGSHITDYSYNAFGRITAEKKRQKGQDDIARVTSYNYNKTSGLLESTTYSDGHVVLAPPTTDRLADLASVLGIVASVSVISECHSSFMPNNPDYASAYEYDATGTCQYDSDHQVTRQLVDTDITKYNNHPEESWEEIYLKKGRL